MLQTNWLLYALLGMLFLSLANFFLKIFVRDFKTPKIGATGLLVLAVIAVVFLAAAYHYLFSGEQASTLGVVLAVIVFSLLGFVCVFTALREGKVALVTAVLSLGTLVLAVLSILFLGDRFTPKEVLAMLFALLSIGLLIL